MRSLFVVLLASFFGLQNGLAQAPFDIVLVPVSIDNLGGIQSYASARHEGKILVLGGRLDGLHRRQPWASFDQAGHNTSVVVIDPIGLQRWTASLSELSPQLIGQLSSTNMEFYQSGDYLYLIGGYGYSAVAGDHITYPNITAVYVPGIINAVMNGQPIASHIRQYTFDEFAVTGGYLEKIDEVYYLIGGQRFDGRYNPMNNPTFTQTYTDAVRLFTLTDDGVNLEVDFLDHWVDANAFHRRDYNAAPQILPDGSQGITAFSGVFRPDADLPWLDAVNISPDGYEVQPDFSQYYNHYHSAQAHLYDAEVNEMHNVFFGGIAQYFDVDGVLTQDNNVPFVRTIARVTRTADGAMAEYKLPVEMPGLLGAGAEFIALEGLPDYANGVIKLDELVGDTVLIGHIYGGIHSSAPNIFWVNDGTQSDAYSNLLEVYLIPQTVSSTHQLNASSTNSLALQVFPNPVNDVLNVVFTLKTPAETELVLSDLTGKTILSKTLGSQMLKAGENHIQLDLQPVSASGTYVLRLSSGVHQASMKVMIDK